MTVVAGRRDCVINQRVITNLWMRQRVENLICSIFTQRWFMETFVIGFVIKRSFLYGFCDFYIPHCNRKFFNKLFLEVFRWVWELFEYSFVKTSKNLDLIYGHFLNLLIIRKLIETFLIKLSNCRCIKSRPSSKAFCNLSPPKNINYVHDFIYKTFFFWFPINFSIKFK